MMERLCAAISRATKQTTGYFAGYTSKRQPVGKYELQQSARTLNLLAAKMKGDKPYRQFVRVTSRMMSDLYGKGTLRTMPEEFNLGTNMHRTDATKAEFLRTYQIREFRGGPYLYTLEQFLKADTTGRQAFSLIPVRNPEQQQKKNCAPISWTCLYGYRGPDARCFHMCPWEFWMHWDPVRLEAPCFYKDDALTVWTVEGLRAYMDFKEDDSIEFVPGVHFLPLEPPPDDGFEYVVLPAISGEHAARMQSFRAHWILRRAQRPYVMAPTASPIPRKNHGKEQRARICSVYWRPWILHSAWATAQVPLIQHLNRLDQEVQVPQWNPGKRNKPGKKAVVSYTSLQWQLVGFRVAWRNYVRGNIVSESAAYLIRNFLMSCVTNSTNDDDDNDDAEGGATGVYVSFAGNILHQLSGYHLQLKNS